MAEGQTTAAPTVQRLQPSFNEHIHVLRRLNLDPVRGVSFVLLQIIKQHLHALGRSARHKRILQSADEERWRVDEEGSALGFKFLFVDPVVIRGAVRVQRTG